MYDRSTLGLVEAQAAVAAMLDEAAKEPDRPVTMAVVDSEGALICYSRMDRARPISWQMAIRKAYTSSRAGTDSGLFGERNSASGTSMEELDPLFTGIRGGVCLVKDGVVLGAIGVSGRLREEDESIARVGAAALGL